MSVVKLLAQNEKGLHGCVGLDPVFSKLPASVVGTFGGNRWGAIHDFNRRIIDDTHDVTAAYKPNLAFYIRGGVSGMAVLEKTVSHIQQINPGVLIILDGKFGDIENTNDGYAEYAFEKLNVDGVTLSPYLSLPALEPYFKREDKLCFVLGCTSNKTAGQFQDLLVGESFTDFEKGETLYKRVYSEILRMEKLHIGLVAGATYPEKLAEIINTNIPCLVPGVGAQGGDLQNVCKVLFKKKVPFLINTSRQVLFASSGDDFSQAARVAMQSLNEGIMHASMQVMA